MEALHTALLALHVLIACGLVGIAFATVVVLFKTQATAAELGVMKAIAKYGKILGPSQLVVGSLLIASEPDKFLGNPLIWAKIGLWVLGTYISVGIIERKSKLLASGKADSSVSATLRRGAIALLVVVVLIVILGVVAAETAG